MAQSLIITGDDFGLSHEVNEAVEAQYLAGRLSQASLMIHGQQVEEARRIAIRNPGLCVGLHLTLCTGSRKGRTQLTDALGNFEASPAQAGWRYFWRRDLRNALAREIEEQFAEFTDWGLPPLYWDGHTHLHLHPTILRETLPISQTYGFGAVRLMQSEGNGPIGMVFNRLSAWARPLLRAGGVRFTEQTLGLRETGRMDEKVFARLQKAAERFSLAEIYYHPGVDGPAKAEALPELTHWGKLLHPPHRH